MAKRRREHSLEEEIDRLYSVAPAEFTAERDALAKQLRADGDRAAGDEVRGLRKPNLPAWAINQAVRAESRCADELIAAGERLAQAQATALEGKGAKQLREAMEGQQAAVESMTAAVAEQLTGRSAGGAMLDRARETLRAIAGDEQLRAQFRAGRLVDDHEAVGFGGPLTAPAKRRRAKADAPDRDAARRRDAERAVSRASRALELAGKRLEVARQRRERAEAELAAAQANHDDAEIERDERMGELEAARKQLG